MILPTRPLAAFGAVCLAALPFAASAQAQPQPEAPVQLNPFGIPENVELFGKNDPNVRTATAIVNGAVITGTDVDHRVALVLAASDRAEVSDQERRMLQMQVLRNLIDETLQIQAAAAQDMPVAPEEVEQRYRQVAARNFGANPDAMDEYLVTVGSSPAALKRQIEGELAWANLLRRNVRPFVNVSTEEVTEMIDRMKDARGQSEYHIAEIYLPATAETRDAAAQNGRQILQQIRDGGSFAAYATQFSESSTKATGGDLGYVRLNTLPTEMSEVAQTMQPGQIVGPVAIPGGFVIMLLIDKRQILTADPRDATLSLKQISIRFQPGVTEAEAQAQVSRFASAVQSMRGCGDADRVASQINAEVVDNAAVAIRSLPAQLQSSMLELQIGQTTPPFGTLEDGIRVLMVCGRDDPSVTAEPDFDETMQTIEDERVAKRAQRFLRDLRNDAIISYN